ncbi:Rieske (2Fe-2S) protein [uncultured Brevundimonas sp.]|uniref:Rieske (2Fe-2S) protein n=1 Tax=uncultured Brevundimonas sp. TaxID=213418 RepID=UPI0030EE041C|tara:strand:- start:133037 stop:133414 length:378 start_codon:yes stop_codon:yes gene_type:complete
MGEPVPAERKRVWITPPGVALCAESDIADPGSRGFVLQIGEAFFHGFVVRKQGQVAGYVDRCPHQGFPLALELDRYLTPSSDLILCGWHGAVFTPLTGACVGGPCAGAKLTPWPVVADGGVIRTA